MLLGGIYMTIIPVIPETKNYWLVRTQSGKYYQEFKRKGFIGINWDEITFQDIDDLTIEKLALKIKENYPEKARPTTTANQLRTFKNVIKPGDTVVITGPASNKFSIGEVVENGHFTIEVTEDQLEQHPKLCPYNKRRKVKWIKEVHKWDVDMPMFKLLQHAQHTITDANDYKDVIESMIHDFYVRGEYAQLSLAVKREEKIPLTSFFAMGHEILELADEFNEYSDAFFIDLEALETQINVNSPGKIKLKGPIASILLIGLLVVGAAGGGITVSGPSEDSPASGEIHTNGLLSEVSKFLNDYQVRKHKELIVTEYMDELDVQTPEELSKLLNAVEGNPQE